MLSNVLGFASCHNTSMLLLVSAMVLLLVSELILFPGCLIILKALILPSRLNEQVLMKLCRSIFTSSLTLQPSSAQSGLFLQISLSELSHKSSD